MSSCAGNLWPPIHSSSQRDYSREAFPGVPLLSLPWRPRSPPPPSRNNLPDPNYVRQQVFDSYDDFKTELDRVANIPDATQRTEEVNLFWQQLSKAGQIPYAQGDRVAFLYRGAGSIAWPGDANGWNPNAPGWQGTPVGQSDIQIVERQLPADARVDYKVFRNGAWILDPANPVADVEWFGPNSELRMPDYEYPRETIVQAHVDRGSLSANKLISSISPRLRRALSRLHPCQLRFAGTVPCPRSTLPTATNIPRRTWAVRPR